jgi:excisionase family DNA binding protein
LFQAAYFTVRLEASVRCQAKERISIVEQRNELASQPLLLTIPQVATKLGLSRAMVYNLINREGLPVVHLGRAVRVSTTSLQKWVEEREESARLSQEEQRFFLAAR